MKIKFTYNDLNDNMFLSLSEKDVLIRISEEVSPANYVLEFDEFSSNILKDLTSRTIIFLMRRLAGDSYDEGVIQGWAKAKSKYSKTNANQSN